MNTTEQVLVIVLAAFLALFLFVGIVLIVKLVSLANKLNDIADSAKDVVNSVENAADTLRRTAGPVAIGKFFMNVANTVIKSKRGK